VLSFILNVMSGFYGSAAGATNADSNGDGTAAAEVDHPQGSFRNWTLEDQGLFMHRMVETLKHAYGRRANLGDPAFLKNDISFRQVLTKQIQSWQSECSNTNGSADHHSKQLLNISCNLNTE
jgi:hypothetical protein